MYFAINEFDIVTFCSVRIYMIFLLFSVTALVYQFWDLISFENIASYTDEIGVHHFWDTLNERFNFRAFI